MNKSGVTDQLASSLNRRDEVPNQELAKKIVAKKDKTAIKELVENLTGNNKAIQNDCIKVLYEVGAHHPFLIAPYTATFLDLLEHRNNRLQWGAMMALDGITTEDPKTIYAALSRIVTACDKGSVITKDHAVNILIKLCCVKQFADRSFDLLNEQLLKAPANQLPMYAERAIPVVNDKNRQTFIRTLSIRLNDLEKESKRKRVERVIKKSTGN